jgi:hypothetical protein
MMFEKKLLNIKCVFRFSLNFCLKHFVFWEELSEVSKMYIGLHVKYLLFFSDFNETWIFSIFEKYTNIRFHENSSSGSQVVSCRQADVMKLIVTFHNLVNVPKNYMCERNITGWESSHQWMKKFNYTKCEVLCFAWIKNTPQNWISKSL